MKTQERNKNKYKYLGTKSRSNKFKVKWNGIPAFIKRYDSRDSLYNHFFISILNHIVFFLLLWGLFSILKITIINPIFKPKEKTKDIEFIINGSQSYRSKSHRSKLAAENKKTTSVQNDVNSQKNIKQNFTKSIKSSSVAKIDDFSIPIPKFKSTSSGSGGLGRKSNSSGGSSYGLNSTDIGSQDGSPNGSGSVNGTGFDKNAARKAVTTYDISPYVNELRRDIRMNWRPSKNSDGKYVELFLRIAKDGRLVILNVKKTSEAGEVDDAALNAVKKALPLNPLPSKYSKSFLDLIFTFNSVNSSIGSRY